MWEGAPKTKVDLEPSISPRGTPFAEVYDTLAPWGEGGLKWLLFLNGNELDLISHEGSSAANRLHVSFNRQLAVRSAYRRASDAKLPRQ